MADERWYCEPCCRHYGCTVALERARYERCACCGMPSRLMVVLDTAAERKVANGIAEIIQPSGSGR